MTQSDGDGTSGPAPDQPLAEPTRDADPSAPGSDPAAKRKRPLLLATVALVAALLLCGAGGVTAFLLLRNVEDGTGAAEPTLAVENFLTAVYTERDAAKAASLVCAEARDDAAIAEKIQEVKNYAKTYESPRFRWDEPQVDDQDAERAVVSVTVTMLTGDERTADRPLTFIVVRKSGWWVCDVV